MMKFIFKVVTVIALLSTTFLALATSSDKASPYNAQLGCMGCHQGGAMQTDEDSENAEGNPISQNQEKNIETK